MKKIKLLLAATAAMFTMGAQAQSWIASEVGAGNFHLYNVGKGQFLTRGNGWKTQASTGANALTLIVEEYDGAYKLRTNVNADGNGLEHLSGGTIYTDQSHSKNSTWTFTKVADASNGPVYTIVSAENHGGGAGSYMMASADNTIVSPANEVTDDYGRWQLVQSWITNTMPVINADGWTTSQEPKFDADNICAEYWNKSGASIKQTVSNLPAGNYELVAVALTRDGMTATLNAGSNTTSIVTVGSGTVNNLGQANTWFNEGNGVNTLEFTHAGGSLEIGLTADNTTGDHWLVWRSFILLFKGVDLSELKAALQTQIDAVSALEGTTTTAAYNAAKNYADGIDMDALTTEEQISAAASELASLVNVATAMQAGYAYTLKAKALYNQTNYNEKVDGAKADFKAVLDAVEGQTTVEGLNTANAAIPAALATFMGQVEFEENGYFDITPFFLTNADFSAGNIDGWETNYVSGQQANNIGYQGANYTNGDVRISQFIEAWRPGATLGDGYLRQTVQGLPEGKFVLEADAIATWQNDDTRQITGAQLFITADGVDYKTEMSTGNGAPQHFSTEFMNTGEGDVIFGLRTVSANCNWLCADNFTVKFYGIDLSPYATLLAQAVAEANAIDSSTLTTGAATALATAVQENNKEWSSSKEYSAAIAAVQDATTTANAVAAALSSYNSTKATVSGLTNVQGYTETVDGATSTFNAAISTADTNVDAAATVDEVAAQEAALIAAAKTFLGGVRSDGEHAFDITFLIANPNFDNNDIEGWTRTFADGTATTRIQCNEFYQATFDFYQTLTDMPKGNYELKVQAFQRPGWPADVYAGYLAGTSKATSVIYINEGETTINHFGAGVTDNVFGHTLDGANLSDLGAGYDVVILNNNGTTMYGPQMMETAALWFSQGYYDNTVLTAVDGDLKLGFKSTAAPAAGDWTIFDNFRLYYFGQSINVAMDEAVAFSALADIEGANVTMARTSVVGFNSVALPFDLTEAQVKEVFGDNAEVYAFSADNDADEDEVAFNTTATAIKANVPVLVKATKASTEIDVDNVTVKMGSAKVESTNFDFVGNYEGNITLAEGLWFIGGGALYKSEGNTTMKGFRAYIQPKGQQGGEVKMRINGITTSISEINGAAAAENGAIFNLAGQRVSKAQKGIFIQNGKKVIVK